MLVDGLHEILGVEARVPVVRMLANAVEANPARCRFVVTTRPLVSGELASLGPHESFELQPADLCDYATRRLSDLGDVDRHVRRFTAALRRSRLDAVARTRLLAAMLCQLYAVRPAAAGRPLRGLSGVHRA